MNNEAEYIVGIYGRSQLEMISIGLLNKDGSPKPTKHMNQHEKDAIAIYAHLSMKTKGISREKLNEMAKFSNEVSHKLINDDTMINNYLLSMMLYRLYLQEIAPHDEKLKILPKVHRQIKIFEDLEGEEYERIRKISARVADNIWRVFVGKAQLSDQLRDLRANKFKKGVA